MKAQSGIYQIRNLINNKIYIGSAVNFERRWQIHQKKLEINDHHSRHLQNAWNLYKEENFIFEIIKEVSILINESKLEFKERLIDKEQYYLDTLLFAQEYINKENNKFLKVGYNMCPTSSNSLGIKRSKEFIKNLSESRKGHIAWNKGTPFSKEVREKMSLSHKGKKLSEETKRKIGLKSKGNKYNLGKKLSEYTKSKMSKAKKGEKHNLYGKKRKKETIKKLFKNVIQYDKNGKFIGEWESIKSIKEKLSINVSNISQVCRGTRKIAGGYKWEYKKL